MKTPHPEVFDIEFDRDELTLAFAEVHRSLSLATFSLFGFIAWGLSFGMIGEYLVDHPSAIIPIWFALILLFVACTAVIAGLVWVLGEIIFRTYGKWRGARRAALFSARVEGAFLRIIDGQSDRKIHFRQIGDYEAVHPKRKVKSAAGSLKMRCPHMGNGTAMLTLFGVKDILVTRDLLAEVDAERE